MNLLTKERGLAYVQLARIDKPIGTLLLLWPTLWALWLAAGGLPNLWTLLVFVVGVFLMRSAGCVINDYADRNFDGHVKRTAGRPLPMGKVKPREVLALFAVLALISFALVLTMNSLTIALSFAALLLAVCYPFMKRYIPIRNWCSAWPSPGLSPWPMRLRPTPCRWWPGWYSSPICCGPSPTTPSTPWWTGMMTSSSA